MTLAISVVNAETFIEATKALRSDFDTYLDKASSTIRVMNSIASATAEAEEGDQYLVGREDDGVVALMIISGGMSKKIDELVAKPGNGSKMVEFAMNLCKGRATLDSFDTDSTIFWGKVGFVRYAELPAQASQGGCKMKLDCTQSERWDNSGGPWRLVRPSALPVGFGPREPQLYSGLGVGRRESIR